MSETICSTTEPPSRVVQSGQTHALAHVGVCAQADDGVGKRAVVDWTDEAGATVRDDLRGTSDVGGHRGTSPGRGLDQRQRHALVVGCQEDEVASRVDVGDVGPPPEEGDSITELDRGVAARVSSSSSPSPATTKRTSSRIDATRVATPHESIGPLHLRQSPDEGDHGPRRRQSEPPSGSSPIERRRDVDARRDHGVLACSSDVSGEQLVSHVCTDRDDARRPGREDALGGDHAAGDVGEK